MKLNLGCGRLKRSGWVNVDISKDVEPDLVADVTKGLPYKDDSVEEVHSGCMIEQLERDEFLYVMNEIWRVLQSGGVFTGYVPSTDPRVMHLDPMDRMFFQEGSFRYFEAGTNEYVSFGNHYGFKPWNVEEVKTNESGIIFFTMRKP